MTEVLGAAGAAAAAATKPWVSILTPVANGWEYLEECATSVFLQTRRLGATELSWEWLIGVNGHGPDGGAAMREARYILDMFSLEAGDPHFKGCTVRVVNLPEARGKVEAMNALAAMATGEWVAVLDCDDTWEPNKLILQRLAVAEGSEGAGADVVGTFCWYFGEVVSAGPALPAGWLDFKTIANGNPIINSSAILRREHARWEDRFGLDDYDLWLRLSKGGARLYNLPCRLVRHRIHAASAFNGKGVQDVNGLLAYHLRT